MASEHFSRLARCERGAVTSDFLILTASVIMVALSFGGTFAEGIENLLASIADLIVAAPVDSVHF